MFLASLLLRTAFSFSLSDRLGENGNLDFTFSTKLAVFFLPHTDWSTTAATLEADGPGSAGLGDPSVIAGVRGATLAGGSGDDR